MKTFTVLGYSVLKGQLKMRFANNLQERIRVLKYNEHTNIELIQIETALTRAEGVEWLQNNEEEFRRLLAQQLAQQQLKSNKVVTLVTE